MKRRLVEVQFKERPQQVPLADLAAPALEREGETLMDELMKLCLQSSMGLQQRERRRDQGEHRLLLAYAEGLSRDVVQADLPLLEHELAEAAATRASAHGGEDDRAHLRPAANAAAAEFLPQVLQQMRGWVGSEVRTWTTSGLQADGKTVRAISTAFKEQLLLKYRAALRQCGEETRSLCDTALQDLIVLPEERGTERRESLATMASLAQQEHCMVSNVAQSGHEPLVIGKLGGEGAGGLAGRGAIGEVLASHIDLSIISHPVLLAEEADKAAPALEQEQAVVSTAEAEMTAPKTPRRSLAAVTWDKEAVAVKAQVAERVMATKEKVKEEQTLAWAQALLLTERYLARTPPSNDAMRATITKRLPPLLRLIVGLVEANVYFVGRSAATQMASMELLRWQLAVGLLEEAKDPNFAPEEVALRSSPRLVQQAIQTAHMRHSAEVSSIDLAEIAFLKSRAQEGSVPTAGVGYVEHTYAMPLIGGSSCEVQAVVTLRLLLRALSEQEQSVLGEAFVTCGESLAFAQGSSDMQTALDRANETIIEQERSSKVRSEAMVAQLRTVSVSSVGASLDELISAQVSTLKHTLAAQSVTVFTIAQASSHGFHLKAFVHNAGEDPELRSIPEMRLAKQSLKRKQLILLGNPIKDQEAKAMITIAGLGEDPSWMDENTSLIAVPLVFNGKPIGALQDSSRVHTSLRLT